MMELEIFKICTRKIKQKRSGPAMEIKKVERKKECKKKEKENVKKEDMEK